ncbi:hypothetical protein FDUTEX481_02569 [Tolypothrix sp. PCC 7601]|nr:hypothetical protein FDUTEX481_02569 [Tolypothrix sp. PCC 7601]
MPCPYNLSHYFFKLVSDNFQYLVCKLFHIWLAYIGRARCPTPLATTRGTRATQWLPHNKYTISDYAN